MVFPPRYRSIHLSAAPPRRASGPTVVHTSTFTPPRRIRRLPSSPAPPRRVNGPVAVQTSTSIPRPIRRLPSSPAPSVAQPMPPIMSEQDHFNAPLYTFQAFAIATAIVMSSATASIAGVMAYLDVRNTAEFTARMRTWVSQSMPLLTAKIYRHPTSHDSVDGDPVILAASIPQHGSSTSTPMAFDHDAAEQRLAEAFDQGGFDSWAEAAAREMEAETEVERSHRSKTT